MDRAPRQALQRDVLHRTFCAFPGSGLCGLQNVAEGLNFRSRHPLRAMYELTEFASRNWKLDFLNTYELSWVHPHAVFVNKPTTQFDRGGKYVAFTADSTRNIEVLT